MENKNEVAMDSTSSPQVAVFGGGCFWCTEAIFQELKGVLSVMSGYSGGKTEKPSYEAVSTGDSGHAEVIKIEFDPSSVSYRDLLTVFFATHDPTSVNRQGNDVGTQYRSVIFYTNEEQKKEAERFIAELNASSTKGKTIVTDIELFEAFYEAEKYHQNYYKNNPGQPYCEVIINPKLEKVQKEFSKLLK